MSQCQSSCAKANGLSNVLHNIPTEGRREGRNCCASANPTQTLANKCRHQSKTIPGEGSGALRHGFLDVEKGRGDGVTHISITISGMTCTGCSTKARNVLSRIPGVTGVKVNFMASTGEFDLDSRTSSKEVISRFERESGFGCAQIVRHLQSLDIVMSSAEVKQFECDVCVGIETVCQVDRRIQCVTFDPTIVGARSILQHAPSKALAAPRDVGSLFSKRRRLTETAWSLALAAGFTIPVTVLAWSKNSIPYSKRSIICLTLATCVQAIAVPEFYIKAFNSLIFGKTIEMDMLVVISITAAYGYSVVAFILNRCGSVLEQGEIWETSSLLITFVLFGRLMSIVARQKAVEAVSIESLQAETALLSQQSEETSRIDARLLQYGDTFVVPPFSKIVTDGKIVSGSSGVNESTMSGENALVLKKIGDSVTAGTMNGSSPLTVRLTRLPGQNSITDIARLVEGALSAKPRVQDLADAAARWFVPVIAGISCIAFIIWIAIASKVRKKDAGGSVGLAITYSIAVLAVSCPCALGLAVPLVLLIGGGVAAKSGAVIKQATTIEKAYRTTDVVFDKTGTLTTGNLEVVKEQHHKQPFRHFEVVSLILALLKTNEHPVSSAVARFLQAQKVVPLNLRDVRLVPGAGVEATWNGKVVKAGNPYWLKVDTHRGIKQLMHQGLTILGITIESDLIAAYGLKSTLRPEAKAVIQDLHDRKITCHIVSGDGAMAVEDVARALNIDQQNALARQVPSTKQDYLSMLIEKGKTVLFCGDGINDAAAVAQAHVGVQIGSSSDITRATADVVLTGGLDGICTLLDISRMAFVRIVFNVVWSAVYNLVAILLAAGAFVKFRIPPAFAGLGELISILPIILVTLTLVGFKQKHLGRKPEEKR